MSIQPSISWENLEQQLQACLIHLYDYAFLHGNPFVHLLVPALSGPDRVEAFRNLIVESIQRLRPGASVPFHSRAARTYNILSMRYVAQEPTSEVIKQLALSERQFYRDHTKAIRNLSAILWEQLTGTVAPAEAFPTEPMALSMQSEVQRLSEHSERERLDLGELLAGAVYSTQPLAEAGGVTLTFESPAESIEIDTDRTLLRQLVLAVLSVLVTGAEPGAYLQAAIGKHSRFQQIVLTLLGSIADPDALSGALDDQEALQFLIKTLKAHVHRVQTASNEVCVTLDISTGLQTVLIVDDNPDAVDLFHRYLAEQPYQILVADTGAQALQLAREARPDIIILDIMLPGHDGLEVLQNLKHDQTTRNIPVLVCSVLDMQPLARSLGADDYLKKPPGQQELLTRLEHWWA